MEYANRLNEYKPAISEAEVSALVDKARELSSKNRNTDVYKLCYSCIDLTSLNSTDSVEYIDSFVKKAVEFPIHFKGIPNVASICVYPIFVDVVGLALGNSDIAITSVAAGFPSSQTYLEVKMLEVAMAMENGADEIDIVINIGQMLSGDYEQMTNEIELIKREMGSSVLLKVIIESGALKTPELIRRASLLSMFAGADFIKTSTGKISVAATPEAAVVMCQAIKDFYDKTGIKVGFKAAGGVQSDADAALYYTIVEMILGKEWLTPALWRIGASSLANNLIGSIEGKTVKYF